MSTEAPAAPVTPTPPPNPAPPSPAPSSAPGSAISEPWVKSWIKPDLTLDHSALDRLPDHLKGMKDTLAKYGKFEDAVVGWQNQQVMAGKKALAPLPPDAPDAVKAERKGLLDTINGVPQNPKDYGLTRPQDLPESMWDGKLADGAAQWAHKNSVSPAALKELMGMQVAAMQENAASQKQYEQQFFANEDKTFAQTIQRDNIPMDRASALVEKGALALGLDLNNEQTKNFLKGSDARLMAMRHALAIGEDRAIPEGGGQQGSEGDPAALAKDVTSNPANPLHAQYWNKDGKFSRAVHEAAVARVNGWLQQAAAKNPPRGRTR